VDSLTSIQIGALDVLTAAHVALSLAAIVAGLVVVRGLWQSTWLARWNAFFLATTGATIVTGFLFPFHGFLPVHGVAIGSTVALVATMFAIYGRQLVGPWRVVFVLGAVASLWLNVVVLIAQLFMKVPALTALAPTLTERPFWIAQAATGVVFAGLSVLLLMRFRHVAAPPPDRSAGLS
jgi:hypothetical protein